MKTIKPIFNMIKSGMTKMKIINKGEYFICYIEKI